MAELVDALDSKSDQACLGASSSLVAGMNENPILFNYLKIYDARK